MEIPGIMNKVCLVIMIIGAFLMVITTYRYRMLIKNSKEVIYITSSRSKKHYFVLSLLYVFIIGYLIGIADVIFRDIKLIDVVIISIFILAGLVFFLMVNTLISMARDLRRRNSELMKTFLNIIDLKDHYTKGHSIHVYKIVKIFYNHLGDKMKKKISRVRLLDAAMLHDIGKMSLKDDILNKKDPLTECEWEEIKKHPAEAKKILDGTYLSAISDWVLYHHERVDGKGYYSLTAEEIPLESKIISIADVYSALCTNRIYSPGVSHAEAISIMMKGAGTQFDETLLTYFMKIPAKELTKLI